MTAWIAIIVFILYGHKSFQLLSFFTQIFDRVDKVIISKCNTMLKKEENNSQEAELNILFQIHTLDPF